MEGGNSAAVADWWIDRRRIGDRVNSGDKQHQANQTYGVLESQSALKIVEPINEIFVSLKHDITFWTEIHRTLSLPNRFGIPPIVGSLHNQ